MKTLLKNLIDTFDMRGHNYESPESEPKAGGGQGNELASTEQDVRNLFMILLFRPASKKDIAERSGWSILQLNSRIQSSVEFKKLSEAIELNSSAVSQPSESFNDSLKWASKVLNTYALGYGFERISKNDWIGLRQKVIELHRKGMILPDPTDLYENDSGESTLLLKDAADVQELFYLMFGRFSRSSDNLDAYLKLGFQKSVRKLLSSKEFSSNILSKIVTGGELPHELKEKTPDERHRLFASRFGQFAIPNDVPDLNESAKWKELIHVILKAGAADGNQFEGLKADEGRALSNLIDLAGGVLSGTAATYVSSAKVENGDEVLIDIRSPANLARDIGISLVIESAPDYDAPVLSQKINGDAKVRIELPGVARAGSGQQLLGVQLKSDGEKICPDYTFLFGGADGEVQKTIASFNERVLRGNSKGLWGDVQASVEKNPYSKDLVSCGCDILAWAGRIDLALLLVEKSQIRNDDKAELKFRLRMKANELELAREEWPQINSPSKVTQIIGGHLDSQGDVDGFSLSQFRSLLGENVASAAIGESEIVELITRFVSEVYADGSELAEWMKHEGLEDRLAAIKHLKSSIPSAAIAPLFSSLANSDLSLLSVEELVAVCDYAKENVSQFRSFEIADYAVGNRELSKNEKVEFAYLLKRIPREMAWDRSSDLFFEIAKMDGFKSVKYLQFLSKLEGDLIQKRPLRSRKRFKHVNKLLFESNLRQSIRNPKDERLRHTLARQMMREDKFEDAIMVLEILHQHSPQNPDVHRDLITSYRKAGWNDKLLSSCRLFLEEKYHDAVAIELIRALRGLDRAHEIHSEVGPFASKANVTVLSELARSHFFCGDFDKALEDSKAILSRYPNHTEALKVAISAAIETNNLDYAKKILPSLKNDEISIQAFEAYLFKYALEFESQNEAEAIEALNNMFSLIGCQDIQKADPTAEISFDSFEGSGKTREPHIGGQGILGFKPVFTGPKVSICMTTYNAEEYIETSVRSLQQQTYENIEIVISDDCSKDGTPDILRNLAEQDPRIKLNLKSTNDGTYVSKNQGILMSTGEFIALQDSDDWSHPDRIAKSMAVLLKRPEVVGLSTDWFRMDSNGRLVIKAGGQISHVCCISFIFRKEQALKSAGLYDSVRIEADMEFIKRLTLIHGTEAIARLRWPLLIGRAHSESLTASQSYGITRTGFTEPRVNYQKSYKEWHRKITDGEASGFLPFPQGARIFSAPEIMLPEREKPTK